MKYTARLQVSVSPDRGMGEQRRAGDARCFVIRGAEVE